jgi:hypothetical protein
MAMQAEIHMRPPKKPGLDMASGVLFGQDAGRNQTWSGETPGRLSFETEGL